MDKMTKVNHGLKFISKEFTDYRYFMFGLALAVSGTHLAKLLTGIPVVWLSLWTLNYWLHHPETFSWNNLKYRRLAFVLPLVYLIHILSVFFSHNVGMGLKDLKIKQVLLIYPLALGLAPLLKPKQFRQILFVFYLSLLLGTFISYSKLFGIFGFKMVSVRQEMAFAISHITYSILFCVAVTSLIWQIFFSKYELNRLGKVINWFFLLWFLMFIFVLQTFTSLFMLLGLFMFWSTVAIFRSKDILAKAVWLITIILVAYLSVNYVVHCYARFHTKDLVDRTVIAKKTAKGHLYYHDFDNPMIENGHYVGLYYCKEELDEAWKARSKVSFDSLNAKHQILGFTLVHYLTSLDLPKDAYGVSKLTDEDIKMIENGYANHIYKQKWSIYPRVYEIIKEFYLYQLGYPAEGHSVIQRVKVVKIAWQMFVHDYFWAGTSNGDLVDVYDRYYDQHEPNLPVQYRIRAHNQYLTYLLTYGIVLGSCVLVGFVVPLFSRKSRQNLLWLSVLVIVLLSFVDEDMLETQAGTAIVGLFYPLFLFHPEQDGSEVA